MAIRKTGTGLRRFDGCAYLTFICFVACILLVLNGIVAAAIHAGVSPLLPDWMTRPRYAQIFMFSVPLLLILVEWWFIDWIIDHVPIGKRPEAGGRRPEERK